MHVPKDAKHDIVLASNETNLTNDSSLTVQGLLQIAPVRIYARQDKHFDTFAVCDSAFSQTWIDEGLMRTLAMNGIPATISVPGIHGTSPITCSKTKMNNRPSNGSMKICINVTASSRKNLLVYTT